MASTYSTPAIPDVTPESLLEVVELLKEIIEAREGRRGPDPSRDRFVKVSELFPQTVNNTTTVTAAAHAANHKSGGSDELSHNELPDVQGGSADEYYHLTESQHTNLVSFQKAAVLGSL